jgi:flagellar assembly protein FliH
MESFESPPLSREKDKTNFVSLQIGGEKKADFIPLEEGGDNYKKRREAGDILEEAQEKAALIEREAYEKGFAQGEKDGLELGEKKGLKVLENIENLFIEINHLKNEILKQYEKETFNLIFAIAKKIIHHQIRLDEEAIKETVLEALYLASEKSKITLRVNPEDFDYVERLRPEFFTKFKELKSMIVTSDPSITRGGCFLETPYGDVDARVETQLEKIYQSLEGVRDKDGYD